MKSEELNKKSRGFTTVPRLEFSVELPSGSCTLTLELTQSAVGKGDVLVVEFLDVAALSLRDFGGGLTQLLLLQVTDISDKPVVSEMNVQTRRCRILNVRQKTLWIVVDIIGGDVVSIDALQKVSSICRSK